jgi:hypothetical protein
MSISFGDQVLAEAKNLREKGFDANQIAGILCKKDSEGKNYGLGILLDKNGKPAPTSRTILEYVEKELEESAFGSYLNSDALKNEVLDAVLRWQRVPEAYRRNFDLLLPSDAGTGAVQTAVQAALLMKDGLKSIGVEEFGWPAYRAIAFSLRLGYGEFSSDDVIGGAGVLPVYQAGPMNTTGRVPARDIVIERASAARSAGVPVALDRAYSGFEYAAKSANVSYSDLMRESFHNQVEPFIEAGTPFCLAISPTKAFTTFALRPCGLLLIYHPDEKLLHALGAKLKGLIRARGSSFEHPVTRAFVKALIKDRSRLESEHAQVLNRIAEAECLWKNLSRGTAMEVFFSDSYAGLFRNPKVRQEAARDIYGAHLYPVFADGRCRLNITGLPADPAKAEKTVSILAKYCC